MLTLLCLYLINYNKYMKRLISSKECIGYSHLYNLIKSFNLDNEYKWLITDIEAYPTKNKYLDKLFAYSEYVICSNKELLEWLEEEDFQFIWGVFSLFDSSINNEDILKYDLPFANNNPRLFAKDKPLIQHPLAILELDSFDSSYLAINSKEDKYIDIFKSIYPKSKENI